MSLIARKLGFILNFKRRMFAKFMNIGIILLKSDCSPAFQLFSRCLQGILR